MSTKQTGKAKQRARRAARPSGRRRGGGLGVFDGMCREVLATQGREILRSGDALEAEVWASYLLGQFGSAPLVGEPDPVAAIGQLVSVARQRRLPEARVCLQALAVVATGGLRTQARAAAGELAASQVRSSRPDCQRSDRGWVDGQG